MYKTTVNNILDKTIDGKNIIDNQEYINKNERIKNETFYIKNS